MRHIEYILKGFGFESMYDFQKACMGAFMTTNLVEKITFVWAIATVRMIVHEMIGLDFAVFSAFVFLICAEFWSGVKVSRKKYKEKFESKKVGRMILKVGTYISILSVLNAFSSKINAPALGDFEMNPFTWLYYTVFFAMVLQMVVSWLENLGELGYKETKGLAGFILRRYNKWFEFEGDKSNREK